MVSGSVALRGGSTVTVDPAELDALAGRAAALATLVERHILSILMRANQPGPASVFDPAGASELLACTGLALAVAGMVLTGCLGLAGSLRAAAAAYREADSLRDRFDPLVRAVDRLPAAAAATVRGHYQQALAADPELIDVGVQLLTGLDGRLTPAQRLSPAASTHTVAAIAGLYADPGPAVTTRVDGVSLDRAGPPRSVAALLQDVAAREEDDATGGAVDVRILNGPHGRRVVVDIAGTTSWDVDPAAPSGQASDFATNLRALANQPSVMSRGIRQALRQAGVTSRDQVMLIGHSQGGMVAAELANELNRDHEFTVTHVVTAGSPIGLSPVPSSISVLSLENRGDVVPELDGSDNPARSGWLTARVDQGPPDALRRHSMNSYVAGAADFDADQDQAVKDWQIGAAGYLDATAVHTTVFRIGRS